jgi:hypothetical protein
MVPFYSPNSRLRKMTKQVYLIHWNFDEAREKVEILVSGGYKVRYDAITPAIIKELKVAGPDAFVIDLSRLPSQGRDIALNFRHAKATRRIPIVFVDGDPEKVAAIKKLLPDAVYSSWNTILSDVRDAIANPLTEPVTPKSVFDGYADSPLLKKLGIKSNIKILLINSPSGFEKKLGPLPEGAKIVRKVKDTVELAIWFIKTSQELDEIVRISQFVSEKGGLWIAWPKKSSNVKGSLNQAVVRKSGLSNKLVDYKICSIDETWSALKFAWRKKQ